MISRQLLVTVMLMNIQMRIRLADKKCYKNDLRSIDELIESAEKMLADEEQIHYNVPSEDQENHMLWRRGVGILLMHLKDEAYDLKSRNSE